MKRELIHDPVMSPHERLLLDVYAQSDPVGLDASVEAIDRQRSLDRWMRMREATLRRQRLLRSGGFASAAALLLCAGHAAFVWNGEREARTAETRRRAAQIEEITLTARKREGNLQDAPVAISAFTDTDLQDRNVRKLQEITASAQSLQFDAATGNASSARIHLRGVGTGDPLSSDDPGVGIHVDGVYLPRAQGALLATSDIEAVEALRGPRGTLVDKNAIGGAINLTSKSPGPSELGGRPPDNVPIVPERAAERSSFATATRDPVVTNEIADNLPRPEDPPAVRPSLRLESPITIAPPSAQRLRELQAQPANDVAVVVPRLEPGGVSSCEQEEHVDAAVPAESSDPTRRSNARCPNPKP